MQFKLGLRNSVINYISRNLFVTIETLAKTQMLNNKK